MNGVLGHPDFFHNEKGKPHLWRKWLIGCSSSILGLAWPHFPPALTFDSESCRTGLVIQLLPNHTGFSAERAKCVEQACLGTAEVSSLQRWSPSVTYGGCIVWNARRKTPLIPLCLLGELEKRCEVLAEAGRPGKTKAGGGQVPPLMNVIDSIVWLGVEWLLPARCQFRSFGQITGAGLCVIYTPNVYNTLSFVPSKS